MTREVLLLRHAKAHKHTDAGDKQRELKDKGKRNAQRIGVWLAKNDKVPDCIISSPAIRAKRTAEKACKTAGLNADIILFDKRLYNAELKDVMSILKDAPKSARRVMLVGHNPSLEQTLVHLSQTPPPRNEKDGFLTKGTLAILETDETWKKIQKHTFKFVDVIEPSTLPRLFPFPDINGTEERARPAYYYTQSSVVPFRRTDDGLEVLIISSSKNKHWVIPKGIHDPGLTAEQSAAKEAREEAGVEGHVLPTQIGSYTYPKWDAECTVAVYPMDVTHVISEKDWEERHRGRKWVSVEEASRMVKNDDVKRIVADLSKALGGTP
ncbi:NUDIX domain-containing protein [Magnetovibrio sp. PR-2]|uniref:NUDIX domain-containing protein n=1 Tax=Magnetovibrio sp. PR-2 TaxID=3120356 RepID=UPI002FCE13D1